MDERPHAATAADDWILALAHELELHFARRDRGAGSVEGAVAQHDALRPVGAENGLLEMANCGEGLAHLAQGRRIDRRI